MHLALLVALGALSGADKITVAIDPGHGTKQNSGAQTLYCGDEAEVMLELSRMVAAQLARAPDIDVVLLRNTNDGPSYARRLQRAAAAQADVLVSLHGDFRGEPTPWHPEPGRACLRHEAEAGFSVLFSDRGEPQMVASRRRLARAVATRMSAAGFAAYSGSDYGSQYDADDVAGVFEDRRGLFMLRRPKMPSIIIETYHLLNADEHAHWSKPKTRTAFAAAVADAIRASVTTSRAAGRTARRTPPLRP